MIVRKILVFLLISMTLLFGSCSLFDVDAILNQAKENLILEQTIVAYDFGLPKTANAGSYNLQVDWESSSSLIEIEKSPLGSYTA